MIVVRRIGLAGTKLAVATGGTIQCKLLKICALVTISVRRVKIAFALACPECEIFELAARRLFGMSCRAALEPERQQQRIIAAPAQAA